jgi:Catalase-related immune-responsive
MLPVRRRAAAIQQAGRREHECAGADGGDPPRAFGEFLCRLCQVRAGRVRGKMSPGPCPPESAHQVTWLFRRPRHPADLAAHERLLQPRLHVDQRVQGTVLGEVPLVREVMDDAERDRLVANIVAHLLRGVTEPVLQRAFHYWRNVDKNIGDRVENGVRARQA